jgi:hypothetical protein
MNPGVSGEKSGDSGISGNSGNSGPPVGDSQGSQEDGELIQ